MVPSKAAFASPLHCSDGRCRVSSKLVGRPPPACTDGVLACRATSKWSHNNCQEPSYTGSLIQLASRDAGPSGACQRDAEPPDSKRNDSQLTTHNSSHSVPVVTQRIDENFSGRTWHCRLKYCRLPRSASRLRATQVLRAGEQVRGDDSEAGRGSGDPLRS